MKDEFLFLTLAAALILFTLISHTVISHSESSVESPADPAESPQCERMTLPERCAHLYNREDIPETVWQYCMGVGPK